MVTELPLRLLPLPLLLLLTQRPLPFGMVSKGKAAKRRRWRMQRGHFEEVARLAAPPRGRESQCHDGVQRGVEALRPPWSSFPPAFQSWARRFLRQSAAFLRTAGQRCIPAVKHRTPWPGTAHSRRLAKPAPPAAGQRHTPAPGDGRKERRAFLEDRHPAGKHRL